MTDYSDILEILSELQMNYDDDQRFEEFVRVHDLGLPLAYCAKQDLSQPTDAGIKYIMETWKDFLELLEIKDIGFNELDDILDLIE